MITEDIFLTRILAIFIFFHEFARLFENSKNKYVQELWALTFHDIMIFKNSKGERKIAKFMFSRIRRLAKIASPENTNFTILRSLLKFLTTVPQCREKLKKTILEHISFLNFRKISQIREKRKK